MRSGSTVPGFDPNDPRALAYRQVPGARVSKGQTGKEGTDYFLKASSGQLLLLRDQEQFLWELLDGTNSFEEIERRFRSRFGVGLAAADFAAFIDELIEAGAIERIPEAEHRAMLPALGTTKARKIEFVAEAEAEAIPDDPRGATGGRERESGANASQAGDPGDGESKRRPWQFTIGNPERAFDAAAAVFWPMRYLCWLLIPLVVIAFMITIKHWAQYLPDLTKLLIRIPQWFTLIATEHVISWFARLAQGVVIHGFGGRVKQLRVNFVLGIFPRLWIDESALRSMPRRPKAWIYATPLLFRLAVFAVGILVWILSRQTHPTGSQIALMIATFGLAGFMMSACPLLPLNGYRVLATLLDQEKLRERAIAYIKLRLRGRPAPEGITAAERWGLAFMAVGTVIVSSIYFGHILYGIEATAIEALNGFGVWVGIGLVIMAIIYAYSLYRYSGKLRAMHRAARVSRARSAIAARRSGR